MSVGDQVEVCLEETSDIWDGGAKVDLLLGEDQQVSLDELSGLLKERRHQDKEQTLAAAGMSYPLVEDHEAGFDLSNATIVMVSNVPDGWRLTHGLQSEQGAWMLDPSELADASLRLPSGSKDTASVQVQVISIVGHAGALERQTRSVTVPPTPKETETTPNVAEHDQVSFSAQLVFDQEEFDLAAGADALLLRGVPEAASLSAGTYDPSLQGWVLRPVQLNQLAICDIDNHQGDIEVVLKAIYFDQANPIRTKIIAKKVIDRVSISSLASETVCRRIRCSHGMNPADQHRHHSAFSIVPIKIC